MRISSVLSLLQFSIGYAFKVELSATSGNEVWYSPYFGLQQGGTDEVVCEGVPWCVPLLYHTPTQTDERDRDFKKNMLR
jgi:hypothetical protein